MSKALIRLIAAFGPAILRQVSPQMREYVIEFVQQLDIKAKATINPFDDMVVDFIQAILAIPDAGDEIDPAKRGGVV